MPAHGVIEEITRALREMQTTPAVAHFWLQAVSKYPPTMLGACEKAIKLTEELVTRWLETGMFDGDPNRADKAKAVVSHLGSHQTTMTHDRHIDADNAAALGIKVVRLEDDPDLQDLVLSVHHAYSLTLSGTATTRIIENHEGVAYILHAQHAK